MLEHPADIESMLWAMHFMERLVHTGPAKEYYGPLLQPAPARDWAGSRARLTTAIITASGTCMMGPASNNMSVVDERLASTDRKSLGGRRVDYADGDAREHQSHFDHDRRDACRTDQGSA
jgi:hypothetical protein